MVSTQLKNISKNGNFPQIEVKIKHIWNHQPVHQKTIWFCSSKKPQFFLPNLKEVALSKRRSHVTHPSKQPAGRGELRKHLELLALNADIKKNIQPCVALPYCLEGPVHYHQASPCFVPKKKNLETPSKQANTQTLPPPAPPRHTFDGWNPAPINRYIVDIIIIYKVLAPSQGGWPWDFWTINSIKPTPKVWRYTKITVWILIEMKHRPTFGAQLLKVILVFKESTGVKTISEERSKLERTQQIYR